MSQLSHSEVPGPKKPKTDARRSPQSKARSSPGKAASGASPKKFHTKRYYSPKKSRPRKTGGAAGLTKSADESVTDGKASKDAASPRSSAEVYYTANFKEVLNMSLLSSNPEHHVISDQETALVEQFMELESSYQQLYVRLFLRKHHWIRVSRISYADIASDLSPILKGLCEKALLVNESDLKDPSVTLNLLQVGELKSLCKQLHMPASVVSSSKAKMIAALFKQDREHHPLFGSAQFMTSVMKRSKVVLGECVRLAERPVEVFSKLMLLFSISNAWLNRDEDTDFSQVIYRMLQVNVGKLVYPDYEINATQPLFKDLDAFEKYYQAVREEQRFQRSLEEAEYHAADRILGEATREMRGYQDSAFPTLVSTDLLPRSLPSFYGPFTRGHVISRIISHGVEYQEKLGKYQEAVELLKLLLDQDVCSQHRRGRWWDRMALNWDYHLKDRAKCLDVIKSGLADPLSSPAIRLSLTQRARRILQSKAVKKRKLSFSEDKGTTEEAVLSYTLEDFPEMELVGAPEVTIDGRQLCGDSSKPFFLTTTPKRSSISGPSTLHSHSLMGVEAYAIEYYMKKEGWPCAVHAENSTFSALFVLLMWDAIFSSVPDVFRAPMQNAPLDLLSNCFYANRKDTIDNKLSWLRAASKEEISMVVEESWKKHCGQVCVGMNWNLFPAGESDAKSISVALGGAVLSNICNLFSKSYRSCCSGLPDLTLWNPDRSTVKFVEVKGPGDKLSSKQVVWLSRLMQWHCSVEVCRVRKK